VWSQKWNSRSRRCSSCARRCWIGWTGFLPPQRDALGVAFGLRAGNAPDRFLVGLAVLSLLADGAEELPVVCVVDDAQWLDRASAQALLFVARRLLAESVALVLVTREPSDALRGFQQLVVEGLRTTTSAKRSASSE
jgi:hypothetical protein